MAIISAYYCGKRSYLPERVPHYAINLRLITTACLAILPIIKAYIIISNTTILPVDVSPKHVGVSDIITTDIDATHASFGLNSSVNTDGFFAKIKEGFNKTSPVAKLFDDPSSSGRSMKFVLMSPDLSQANFRVKFSDQATSAKPIDYLVAGTEGLAWVVHFFFILTLRRSRSHSLRGPVIIRALIFMLIGVSAMLLRTHVKHDPYDDVVPSLSLGFSISVVTLLSFYALTLIPSYSSVRATSYREVSFQYN